MTIGLVVTPVAPAAATHGPPSGSHTPITSSLCGQTLSTPNTTYALYVDVGPCNYADADGDGSADWGIKIAADGITLDLNGHNISGCNDPLAVGAGNCNEPTVTNGDGGYTLGEGIGVYVVGVKNVVVTNSKATWNASAKTIGGARSVIRHFDQGVVLAGGKAGTCAADGTNNQVKRLVIEDNIGKLTSAPPPRGEGVAIETSDGNKVFENEIRHNGPYAGVGVFGDSERNRIYDNRIDNNNTMTNGNTFQTSGVRLEGGSCTTVNNNRIAGSSLEGVSVFARNHSNTITNNTIVANGFHFGTAADGTGPYVRASHRLGDGIRLFATSNNNTISGNVVCGNAGSGIRLDGAFSAAVGGSHSNTISNNSSGTNCPAPHTSLCAWPSPSAVLGGWSCAKNNAGKDSRSPDAVMAAVNNSNIRQRSYDLYDGNPGCTATTGTANAWSGSSWGANSWGALASAGYDDTKHPLTDPCLS